MDVSIITINYNNSQLTIDFVKSVLDKTSTVVNYEIIVIDNASNKDEVSLLKKGLNEFPFVKIVVSNINLGFGAGNMLGTQFASGKYFAFINNDIIFTEDCLSSLCLYMNNNDGVGVCTPQQINAEGRPVSCFDYFHGLRKMLFGRWMVELTSRRTKRENKHYKETISADFIQGCFMFFDAEKFAEVGGFDTNLFLYYEEMDICLRLKKKGYESCLYPETSFIHLHGASTNKKYIFKRELLLSRLYIIRKNNNYVKYNIIRFYILLQLFFKAFFKFKNWELFFIVFSGRYLENSLKTKQVMNLSI